MSKRSTASWARAPNWRPSCGRRSWGCSLRRPSADPGSVILPRAMSRRNGRRRGSPHAGHPGRDLAAFLLVAVITLVAVAAGTAVFSERVARASALAEAERSAVRMAQFLIAPILEEALAGVPGRWEELERRVTNRLEDQSVKALFIWT